jgi:hypothetical protein
MMLDDVSIGVSDLERSRRFYDTALGIVRTLEGLLSSSCSGLVDGTPSMG